MADPILVVLPTHDRPRMCAEAVASVIAQTDPDWVLVVVDDGETSPIGAAEGWPRDPRVHLVRSTTRTAGGARNAGIAYGEGGLGGPLPRLVAFLDDDDLWLEGHLAAARVCLATNPRAAFCHGAALTRDGQAETSYHARETGPLAGDLFKALLRRDVVATSSVVARLDAVRAAGGFRADVRHGQDWDLWLKLARAAPIAFVPEVTAVYRSHGANISRNLTSKIDDQIRVFEPWWARRHLLSRSERRLLSRECARRHRRRVKRLLSDGSVPRREVLALARRAFLDVPGATTARALLEALCLPRGRRGADG